jgi:1-acyl-sn-glycerol-3-phosphate acyltransferase
MTAEQTSRAVRLFRLLRFLLHVLRGLATVAVFPMLSRRQRSDQMRRWAAGILDIFNVSAHIEGTPPGRGEKVVFVANHVSWLDPALLMTVRPAYFVAKSEIRAWPVLGWLAARAGTLFIERHRRHDTYRITQTLGEVLSAGDCAGIFPEGSTTDGTALRPFHSSLLQAAVWAEAVVYPVAIRYRQPDGSVDTAPAYSDNISFVASLRRVLSRPEVRAELIFAQPISVEGKSRHELAKLAEQAVAGALGLVPTRPGQPS